VKPTSEPPGRRPTVGIESFHVQAQSRGGAGRGRALRAPRRDSRRGKIWRSSRKGGIVNKLPRTKNEIQDMVIAELRRFADCEEASGVVVVGLDDEISGATWTVSRFNRGESDAYACDRALQVIVPHYQRLYDLKQKH